MKPTHAIYALCVVAFFASASVAVEKEKADKPALVWRDAETRRILFTSADIVAFDWEKQVFLLQLDATLNFLAWVPPHMHQARKLAAEDSDGVFYEAFWVSGSSSMGFKGPIYSPLSPNPYFSIKNGYPAREAAIAKHDDPRFAQRLHFGLEKAGVLHSINLAGDSVGLIIQATGHPWKAVGEDMQARVEYFENTFRIGRRARAHVFFAGGEETRKRIDFLVLEIKFLANDGSFRSDFRTAPIPVSVIREGVYACDFDPWKPVDGSDAHAEVGTGAVSLSVLFQKKEDRGDKTIYRLDFNESRVPIGGRIAAEKTTSASADEPQR